MLQMGEKGTVVGVDPRPHLLEVATGSLDEFAAKLGRPPALKFLRGYPENLEGGCPGLRQYSVSPTMSAHGQIDAHADA